MSTVVKNQLRVCLLSVKYNIMRAMVNRVAFLMNILFMILNNASFIIQWLILLGLKPEIGGYTLWEIMLFWGLAASSYGLANIFFARAFSLPDLIISGKLDSFLVQPKSVLLSVITSATASSAIGDFLYGLAILCAFCFSVQRLLLFLLFAVTGAVIITAFAVLMGSLSFWFFKAEVFGSNMVNSTINFSTYPDGIFDGAARFLLYQVIPVGMAIYRPVHVMISFDLTELLMVLGYAVLLSAAAAFLFYRGLRRYSSSNLMEARI